MRRALVVFFALAAMSCGPSLSEVRRYMAGSPHRRVAVFPLDASPGGGVFGKSFAASLRNKLRNEGFLPADRARTEKIYDSSELSKGAFGAAKDAAALAQSLGSGAALVGRVDRAWDRVERRPAVYRFEPVAPPACCFAARNPCPSHPVFDTGMNAWTGSCSGTHRRYLAQPARNARLSLLAVHWRLIDAADSRVIWETSYSAELAGSLNNVSDAVGNILVDQLADAYLKRGL